MIYKATLKKNKRNNKLFKWQLFIIFLNEHLLEAVVGRWSAKKMFLQFHKIYNKKPVPVACDFI